MKLLQNRNIHHLQESETTHSMHEQCTVYKKYLLVKDRRSLRRTFSDTLRQTPRIQIPVMLHGRYIK
jgi:hypothetical protein